MSPAVNASRVTPEMKQRSIGVKTQRDEKLMDRELQTGTNWLVLLAHEKAAMATKNLRKVTINRHLLKVSP